jgi:hypothetical protein
MLVFRIEKASDAIGLLTNILKAASGAIEMESNLESKQVRATDPTNNIRTRSQLDELKQTLEAAMQATKTSQSRITNALTVLESMRP